MSNNISNVPVRSINDLTIVPTDANADITVFKDVKIPVGNLPLGVSGEAVTLENLPNMMPVGVQTKEQIALERKRAIAKEEQLEEAIKLLVSGSEMRRYETLALAKADIENIPTGVVILIDNDGSNNGWYYKQDAELIRSGFDPITLTKPYIDVLSNTNHLEDSTFYYDPNGVVIKESHAELSAIKLNVKENQIYVLNTKSFSVANSFYVTDGSNNILKTLASAETLQQDYVIKIPNGAVYLYVNCLKTYTGFKFYLLNNELTHLRLANLDLKEINYYTYNSGVILNRHPEFFSKVIDVVEDTYFRLRTSTYGVAPQYFVTDINGALLESQTAGDVGTEYTIRMPKNASKLYLNGTYVNIGNFNIEKIDNNLVKNIELGSIIQDYTFFYSTGGLIKKEKNSGLLSIELQVKEGQQFLLDTKTFGPVGHYYITDLNNQVIASVDSTDIEKAYVITMPTDAFKLYVNCTYTYLDKLQITKILTDPNTVNYKTVLGTFYRNNNGSIEKNIHPDFDSKVIDVKEGQKYLIQTKTYGIANTYCITDKTGVLLEFKPTTESLTTSEVTIPNNGSLLYINCLKTNVKDFKITNLSNIPLQLKDVSESFPKINYFNKLKEYCPNFYHKFKNKNQDVTVVLTGTSLTQGNLYTSERVDAKTRPAALHTKDLASAIFDKLIKHWDGQQYRRYDHEDLTYSNSSWTITNNIGNGTWDDYAHIKNGLTKTTTDANASVAITIPSNAWQVNFVYRSDSQSGTSTILVNEGTGKIEVFTGTAWVEAHNYVFTMYEEPATSTKGNTQYQKRLKMRCKNKATNGINSLGENKRINIVKGNNGNRFNVIGFEWSPREFMFNVINGARGGFEWGDPTGNRLDKYQDTDIWSFKPDLLMTEITAINWGASEPAAMSIDPNYYVNIAKRAYFDEFNDMPTSLHAKSEAYTKCDVVFYSDTLAASSAVSGAWDSSTKEPKFATVTAAATNGSDVTDINVGRIKTNFENYEAVESYISSKESYLFIPILSSFKSVAEKHYGGYWLGMQPSGATGKTLSIDGVHFNDNGAALFSLLVASIFDNL